MTGWTYTVWPVGRWVKVIARNGPRVIHLDKLDAATVDTLDFDALWSGKAPVGPLVDFVAVAA